MIGRLLSTGFLCALMGAALRAQPPLAQDPQPAPHHATRPVQPADAVALPQHDVAEPPSEESPQSSVVLLRNGRVLSGIVSRDEGFYVVTLPGGEIRLTLEQVDAVCGDLVEAYGHQRAAIRPGKVDAHLDLAQWCIRQELFDEAANELVEASALDLRNPRIALVERQLKAAQHRPPPRTSGTATTESVPTAEELDRLLRGMPSGTVETYVTTVQPLLLNTCATAGCHGLPTENRFRLLRTQSGKAASRRLTQRNLHAVLQTIDYDDPADSPLLTVPIAPHGTAKTAIFTTKEAPQYGQLAQWVMRISRHPAPTAPASVESPGNHLLQQLPSQGALGRRAKGAVYDPFGLKPELPPAAPATDGVGAPLALPHRGEGAALPGLPAEPGPASEDPLDPEAFNRRFFPWP